MKSQTMNLLKKEIILGNSVQTMVWMLCCLTMFFIPNYPAYVGPFYITISIMMTFALNQSAHDILYTVLLPVRKIDAVKARFLYCGMLEMFAVLIGVIAGFVKNLAHFPLNGAGSNITVAFFGLLLTVYSVFNLIFLGNVYKNPLKPGLRFFAAAAGYFITYGLCEIPVWAYYSMAEKFESGEIEALPVLATIGRFITSLDPADLVRQLPVLLAGIVLFALSWILTFRRAARQFEKYDL